MSRTINDGKAQLKPLEFHVQNIVHFVCCFGMYDKFFMIHFFLFRNTSRPQKWLDDGKLIPDSTLIVAKYWKQLVLPPGLVLFVVVVIVIAKVFPWDC